MSVSCSCTSSDPISDPKSDHKSVHISLNFKPPIKLTSTNYYLWKPQIISLLRSYDLFRYVDGDFSCPAKFIRSYGTHILASDSYIPKDLVTNPLYTSWQHQDQAIYSWLLSALTEECQSQIHGELHDLKKCNDSMQVYFNRASSLSHQLDQISRRIHDDDLVFHILHGLPNEYNAFNTSVNTQQLKNLDPITLIGLLGLLLSEESRLNESSSVDLTTASANVTQQQYSTSNSFLTSSSPNYQRTNPYQNQIWHPNFGGYGRPYSGGRHSYSGGNFRGRSGFRGGFSSGGGRSFRGGRSPPGDFFPPSNPPPVRYDYYTVCQYCNKLGHSAAECRNIRLDFDLPVQAHHTFDEECYDDSFDEPWFPEPEEYAVYNQDSSTSKYWLPDSGATHHMTSNLANLNLHSPYEGSDQFKVGNRS
ncbi:hypothetical protein MKX01_030108, partial [Papaver californicum]